MKKIVAICILLISLISIKQAIPASNSCPACRYLSEQTRQTTQKVKYQACFYCNTKIEAQNNQYCRFFIESNHYDFHFGCFEEFSSLFKELSNTCEKCKDSIKSTLLTIPQNCRGSRVVNSHHMNEYSGDVVTEISSDQEPIGRCWACTLLFFPCLIRYFLGDEGGCKDCLIAYAEACKIACCCQHTK